MKKSISIIPVGVLFFLLACSATAQDEGKTDCYITSGNLERHFIVYSPPGISDKPVPVVFMFHGASGNGERFYNISGWKEKADREGFIAVFPTGKRYCLSGEERNRFITRWNAGSLHKEICDDETLTDDVQFFRDMVDYIKENYPVDSRRIYASGFSDGAGFVSRLTVEASDILTATAVVAGMLQDTTWQLKSPIPFFLSVGQNEKLLAGTGGEALPVTLEAIENHSFLMGIILRMVDKLKLEREFELAEQEHYLELVFNRSLTNAGNQMRFALIRNLGHNYPNGRNHPLVMADVYWEFFRDKVKIIVPALEDVSYGPFDRNKLDFWMADSKDPSPVVVFIHGGGFGSGDKRQARRGANLDVLKSCLANGISFAAVNYRFRETTRIDTILLDIARAIQFIRYKSDDWNVDSEHIAAYGGSAGGGAAVWLAFRDDLADPDHPDSVLRESTRLSVAGHLSGQATYDFSRWADILDIPGNWMETTGNAEDLALYHISDRNFYDDPGILRLRKEVDMIIWMDTCDSPVFFLNPTSEAPPETNAAIAHHPRHAIYLKNKCDSLGIENALVLRSTPENERVDMVDFFLRYLQD